MTWEKREGEWVKGSLPANGSGNKFTSNPAPLVGQKCGRQAPGGEGAHGHKGGEQGGLAEVEVEVVGVGDGDRQTEGSMVVEPC